MKRFLTTLLFMALLTPLQAKEQEWSEAVNGLRARLSLERQEDSPFLKVFVEFQNTSDVAGIRTIRFTPETITPEVIAESGTPLKSATGAYDGMSPTWTHLKLPFEGTLRFRISFPGLGYRPKRDKTIIDLGPLRSWIIPDDNSYYLSGSLTIPKRDGDHSHSDWSGTLTLPRIAISRK